MNQSSIYANPVMGANHENMDDNKALVASVLARLKQSASSQLPQDHLGGHSGNNLCITAGKSIEAVSDEQGNSPPGTRVKRKYVKRPKEPVHHYPVPPRVVQFVNKSKTFVNHR